jgi:hypothetical protein
MTRATWHEPWVNSIDRACMHVSLRLLALTAALASACGSSGTDLQLVDITRGGAVSAWDGGLTLDAGSDGGSGTATDASVAMDAAKPPPVDAASDADAGSMIADAAAPSVDAGPSAPLVFSVTTVAQGGEFAPKNVGAIWIEDASGAWVKTLAVWAGVSTRFLTSYCAANKTGNKMDAITSATLAAHKTHQVTWDLTGADHKVVADGDYNVLVECTDHNGTGKLLTVPFHKAQAPMMSMPADTPYFHALELRYAGE